MARRIVLNVSDRLLLEFLAQSVPPDASIVGASYDAARAVTSFIIQSDEFQDLLDGMNPPQRNIAPRPGP